MSKRNILTATSASRVRLGLVALGLVAVLGVMAVGIARSHEQTKHQILSSFKLRGKTSAEFVTTYLSQQATRETQSAQKFLSGHNGLTAEFDRVVTGFGSGVGGLFDGAGLVIATLPADPALIGTDVAAHYSHLQAAEAGHAAVSGVVPSAVRHEPIVAVAVPFSTP